MIFICNFDPYDEKRYIYTFRNRCDQNHDLLFGDDAAKVVVNTKGTKGEISPELKEAILYLDHEEVTGPYSKELDDAVNELKSNEERGQESTIPAFCISCFYGQVPVWGNALAGGVHMADAAHMDVIFLFW